MYARLSQNVGMSKILFWIMIRFNFWPIIWPLKILIKISVTVLSTVMIFFSKLTSLKHFTRIKRGIINIQRVVNEYPYILGRGISTVLSMHWNSDRSNSWNVILWMLVVFELFDSFVQKQDEATAVAKTRSAPAHWQLRLELARLSWIFKFDYAYLLLQSRRIK